MRRQGGKMEDNVDKEWDQEGEEDGEEKDHSFNEYPCQHHMQEYQSH